MVKIDATNLTFLLNLSLWYCESLVYLKIHSTCCTCDSFTYYWILQPSRCVCRRGFWGTDFCREFLLSYQSKVTRAFNLMSKITEFTMSKPRSVVDLGVVGGGVWVCIQWGVEVSQNWDKLEGADSGQTHVDHPEASFVHWTTLQKRIYIWSYIWDMETWHAHAYIFMYNVFFSLMCVFYVLNILLTIQDTPGWQVWFLLRNTIKTDINKESLRAKRIFIPSKRILKSHGSSKMRRPFRRGWWDMSPSGLSFVFLAWWMEGQGYVHSLPKRIACRPVLSMFFSW